LLSPDEVDDLANVLANELASDLADNRANAARHRSSDRAGPDAIRSSSPAPTGKRGRLNMPSLLRFLTVVALLGAVVYGGLYSLAHFVQPKPREITVAIPPDKFFKNR
jgi:hypothetical protein